MKSLKELLAWAKNDLPGFLLWVLGLQEEVQRLKDLLAQNSKNSSRPPSGDRQQRGGRPQSDSEDKPKPKSLRGKSGRKPGGQPGHAGHTLQFSTQPENTEIHRLPKCPCGEDLSGVPADDYQRRQVFDLPPLQLHCTEHRAEIKDCPGCQARVIAPFPAGVRAPLQYGRNFRAVLKGERPLRMIKVRLKVSGCFRTLAGARRHARIASYISTLRKHHLPVFHHLVKALHGQPFLPAGPGNT